MSLIHQALTEHFGLSDFRNGQETVIHHLLSEKSVIVTMPTGSGKSLCYQLPALLKNGITLVVSPLIALMKDQVDALDKLGIPSTFINSTLNYEETLHRFSKIKNNEIKLLYVAPERFNSGAFIELLKTVNIALFIVDEAHCISQWGHDFRPSYLRLKNVFPAIGNPTVGAFTATATPQVRDDIKLQLGLPSTENIVTGFDRKNLKYFAISLKNDKEKQAELLRMLSKLNGSGIIYVGTKKLTESLTALVFSENYAVAGYHGGMEKETRERVHNDWISGKTDIIVATNAFGMGMGIDKPNVRFVFHYTMPGTIEAYMQESGRAGRDGETSYCVAFSSYSDVRLQEFFIENAHPPKEKITALYQFLHLLGTPDIYLTHKEMAKQAGSEIKDAMVGHILVVLEKANLLKRLNRHNHQMDIDLLEPTADLHGQNQKLVFDFIVKEVKNRPSSTFSISPDMASQKTGITQSQLSAALVALESKEIILYTPPFRGRGVRLMGEKISLFKLPIDFDEIEKHFDFQMKQLETMKQYFTISSCRRRYLLRYFGENLTESNCKCCDVCLDWEKPEESTNTRSRHFQIVNTKKLIFDIVSLVGKMDGRFGRDVFAKTLAGSKSKSLQIQLKKHPLFAKYEHITKKYIVEVMDDLIDLGYLHREKGIYPTIRLSAMGQKIQAQKTESPNLSIVPKISQKKSTKALSMSASLQMTWDLFQENLSIKEIAKERNYAVSTIVNHLCKLIELGKEINILQFVSQQKIHTIKKAIQKTSESSLSAIKSNIADSENCSFDDIRFVLTRKTKKRGDDKKMHNKWAFLRG